MFATQKIFSRPSPLFWQSQKIEVKRQRKSNILHPALNRVFSLFWLPSKSGLWEGEKGRLWAVVTISLVWRSHASPTSLPLHSQSSIYHSYQNCFGHPFPKNWYIYWYGTIMKFLGVILLPQTCCDSTPLLYRTNSFPKTKKPQWERCVLIMALQQCRSPFNLTLQHEKKTEKLLWSTDFFCYGSIYLKCLFQCSRLA